MWIIAHVQSASTKISRLGEVFAHVARSDLSIRAARFVIKRASHMPCIFELMERGY
jgi:hypothetical protein